MGSDDSSGGTGSTSSASGVTGSGGGQAGVVGAARRVLRGLAAVGGRALQGALMGPRMFRGWPRGAPILRAWKPVMDPKSSVRRRVVRGCERLWVWECVRKGEGACDPGSQLLSWSVIPSQSTFSSQHFTRSVASHNFLTLKIQVVIGDTGDSLDIVLGQGPAPEEELWVIQEAHLGFGSYSGSGVSVLLVGWGVQGGWLLKAGAVTAAAVFMGPSLGMGCAYIGSGESLMSKWLLTALYLP